MSVFRLIRRQAFALAIILCAASAYLWPGLYIEWFGVKLAPFVGPSIQLIMFGMGTTLTAADFLRVAKAPWGVAVGAVLQFSIMPLAALGVAKVLGFQGELAAGTSWACVRQAAFSPSTRRREHTTRGSANCSTRRSPHSDVTCRGRWRTFCRRLCPWDAMRGG